MATMALSIAELSDVLGVRIGQHMELAMRGMLASQGAVADTRYLRLVTGEAHPLGNFAFIRDSSDESGTTDAADPLVDCGSPAAVIFSSPASADVDKLLVERGFVSVDPLPAMAVDIEQLASTSLPDGYEFIRVGPGASSEGWVDALAEGYELPRRLAAMFAPAIVASDTSDDATTQCFAIFRDGKPVATSLLYCADGVAGIYCVATVAAERSKGLGAHVTAEPLRLAYQRGYRVGILQSSPDGYPVYKRIGFGDFGEVPMYLRMPDGAEAH